MFKSPRFVSVIATLSIAGAAMIAMPAVASPSGSHAPEFRFKAKIENGQTVYCAVKNEHNHRLPYHGCMSKVRWGKKGIALQDSPQMIQFAANVGQRASKGTERN